MESCEKFRVKSLFCCRWKVRSQTLHMNKMSKFLLFLENSEKNPKVEYFLALMIIPRAEKSFLSFLVSRRKIGI